MTEHFDRHLASGEPAVSEEGAVPKFSPDHRYFLELAQEFLTRGGFYSYLQLDDQQRWSAAADDEAGRVDVRLEERGYLIEICGSSPGLYMDEDSDWRRQALERLARRAVPNIAHGMLDENQTATWSEDDRGVAVCIHHSIPLEEAGLIPAIARQNLDSLDALLTRVESELRS